MSQNRDVVFIRRGGRVIPIRKKSGGKQSEFQKNPIKTGAKTGLKYGAILGASAGAVTALSFTGAASIAAKALSKATPDAGEARVLSKASKFIAAGGVMAATPLLAGAGAVHRGIHGAVIGTGVGAAYAAYKAVKNRKKK